jgi:hypothetical protein
MKSKMFSMKRIFLASLLGLGLVTGVQAQQQQTASESSLSPKFGVKGGINLSNLYEDEADDENVKLGFNLGLYAKLPVTRGFSIQPELIYSGKGSKLTYNNILLGKGEYRFNLNYVELPVLAVINLGKNLNLQAGPYIAYLASANIKDMDNNGNITGATDLKADNFNRFDYGVAGGLGLDVQNFTIGARYNYGLQEIGDEGVSGRLTRNSKNSVLSVFIGFGF